MPNSTKAILIIALFLFPTAVAARCTGEASFGIALCSCTVKNRLAAGWSQHKVLSAYYAPDVYPTEESIETARQVLAGERACNTNAYYLFELSSVRYLGLRIEDAADKACDGGRCVYAYPRDALRR